MKINQEKNSVEFSAKECCIIVKVLEIHVRAESDLGHFTDKSKELLEKLKLNSELSKNDLVYFIRLHDDLLCELIDDSDLPDGSQELIGEISILPA